MSEIILLSERGWQGARSLALMSSEKGKPCSVIIKGRPAKEVRDFISLRPRIINYFIPRQFFFFFAVIYLLWKRLFSHVGVVLIERPKAERLIRLLPLRFSYLRLQEIVDKPYFELFDAAGNRIDFKQLLDLC